MSPQFSRETEAEKPQEQEWFIPEDIREQLRRHFEQHLEGPVELAAFTREGENDPYNAYLIKFINDLARLSAKLTVSFHTVGDEVSARFGVASSPTLLIAPEKYALRFAGAPMGEEGRAFIEALRLASTGKSALSPQSRKVLAGLTEKRHIEVFSSPG